MIALENIHARYIYGRRVSSLAKAIERLLPTKAKVLDLGCGDGLVGHHIFEHRGDVSIFGAEVLLRSNTFIPAVSFDGWKLPFESDLFDAVLMLDVLHHTQDLSVIFLEAARVSKKYMVVKDHVADSVLAKPTLRFMDIVGNLRYGVALPFGYQPKSDWFTLFGQCALKVDQWDQNLGLYPWWAE